VTYRWPSVTAHTRPYPSARHPCGEIRFKGRDLIKLSDREMRRVRGDSISIVFQEPMTSLNPLHTIEKQISEILLLHRGLTGAAALEVIRTSCPAVSANAS
jgi:microcin C transport system ATP-binding protein